MLDAVLVSIGCAFFVVAVLTRLVATGSEEGSMLIDYGLAAAVTLGLLAYLVYALIRPERF